MAYFLVTVRSRQHPTTPQHLYLLGGDLVATAIRRMADDLLHDPVVQQVAWFPLDTLEDDPHVAAYPESFIVDIAYNPGVTDNEAESVKIGAAHLGISGLQTVRTLRRYTLHHPPESVEATIRNLYNPLIQTPFVHPPGVRDHAARRAFYEALLRSPEQRDARVAQVPLRPASDDDLMRISRAGVLSLDLDEMRAIQAYFRREGRDPADGELETLAQTWSEHCSHKTFKARVRYRVGVQGSGIRDQGSGIRDQGSGIGDQGSGIEDHGSGIRDRGSGIGDQENLHPSSFILHPSSFILHPSERYAALQVVSSDCEIDSLIRTFLMAATDAALRARYATHPDDQGSGVGDQGSEERARLLAHAPSADESPSDPRPLTPDPWVLSAFVDNAGIVAFGPDHEISFKVETHNHPSALEPFGGANTGVGGVVRDVLGVSAQPIAVTDVLCFGPLDLPEAALTPGVLHPRRVAAGVVAGVRDYGNKLGIPTVNGAVLYDPGFVANPLVFCGTIGLAPRGLHPREARPGDVVVVLGGRTGRDGIHGATFSSAELTHTTAAEVGSAVQIGDPITEKKLLDVLLQARDARLYSAITDCGAGGLSSAVGEMGERTGVAVELAQVPLKYAGLQPWEVWVSEAQERMVLAVPPEKLDALLALCAGEDVEATVIGRFTGDRRLLVSHAGEVVVDLAMDFLHHGRPQRVLDAVWTPHQEVAKQAERDMHATSTASLCEILIQLLAHPNIASKAPIVRTYDHEVQGRTVVKPLVGGECDGPGDAAVLQPLRASPMGIAIGCGINPRYGAIDPYWMALACVDEALRNVVAVGGDPAQAAILDNFCWGDPREPDRMAGLVRAVAGCYDAAVAFGTPFISGKDSLNNEYRAPDGSRTPIPPTLLISALAIVPDIRHAVTMDLKEPGNHVYLVGSTQADLGGSHFALLADEASKDHLQSRAPQVDLETAPQIMAAVHLAIKQGLVRACHDLNEGGLGVAAAEMAFAGGWGLHLDLASAKRPEGFDRDELLLFAESPSRFLVEVRPGDAPAFEATLARLPHARIGQVVDAAEVVVVGVKGDELLRAGLAELKAAWQSAIVV